MKKIIKHYPMTDRLIVRRGYKYMSMHPVAVPTEVVSPIRRMIPLCSLKWRNVVAKVR